MNPAETDFDFWLGSWQLSWPAEQTPNIEPKGSNSIRKCYDGKVIQEIFSTADGSFRGMSISVYDNQTGLWQQTWADNQGGYLVLTGKYAAGVMELRTEPKAQDHKLLVNRMRFTNIETDTLNWHWQRSEDGGETWQDSWTIRYARCE